MSSLNLSAKAYFELTKPAVSALLALGGLAGGFLAFSRTDLWKILAATLITYIAASGINSVTNYIDKDIDSIMDRTKKRPLPSGRIYPPIKALYFGIALIALSCALADIFSIYSTLWILVGVLFDPILYNYLTKRVTAWNIVIGSFAGGAPVFVVWSAVTNKPFAIQPFLLYMLIILWTPIHIWSIAIKYKDDYVRAHVPMLPVVVSERKVAIIINVFTVTMFIISWLLYYYLSMPLIYLILLIALSLILLGYSLNMTRKLTKESAFSLFKLTNIYLAIVFLVIIIAEVLK
ncbi:MAG: heme o synthase [Sulfolobaceae archaeon]|nr:heme o synthase [Sulfolobaceae archaeon]